MAIDGKSAVQKAKDYFTDLTGVTKPFIEAVFQERNIWRIVFGFFEEPPQYKEGDKLILPPRKVYKEIQVDSETGSVLAMKFVEIDKIIEHS
ncbi:MAG: hypothetical protein A2Y33_14470 [Spirochaetes bacterium GWF1_51_8]|nr:MAG: hypothetical protein A2Y33_14470 [Spirochaetes bacterium GWF1_51_8]